MSTITPAHPVDIQGRTRESLLFKTHWTALAVAILAVLLIRMSTPIAKPMTDGLEYLKVASAGLQPQAQLGAPFVYRFAVPLLVHGITLLTGAEPAFVFQMVALTASVLLLVAVYVVALVAGARREHALLIMMLLASSLFMVRFPLYCPYDVDLEACLVACIVFALLLRGLRGTALAIALVGLLFKEFLLAPLVAIIGLYFEQYIRERATKPLRWTLVTIVLTVVVFLLPRLLIPVTYGFGAIIRLKTPAPSQTMYFSELRTLLAWPPDFGTALNILLSLASFCLPALMLITPQRGRMLWEKLGANRTLIVLWMLTVVLLMAIGGTKTMVFAVYSAPVLVLVVSLLLRGGVGKMEIGTALIGTLFFNRMMFNFGMPDAEPGPAIAFYGAYWHTINEITAWRFAEICGWVLVASGIRRWSGSFGRSVLDDPIRTH